MEDEDQRCLLQGKTTSNNDSTRENIDTECSRNSSMKTNEKEQETAFNGDSTEELIGRGSYGDVYRRQNENGETVAEKIITNIQLISKLSPNLSRLCQLNHPNIVKILDTDQQADKLCIVMEFCQSGDLNHYFTTKNPEHKLTLEIMVQIASGVAYLHSQRIIHRDIKPANILVASDCPIWIKLTDFDLSKFQGESSSAAGTNIGTHYFKAVELFQNQAEGHFHPNLDIYSMALTFLAMVQHTEGSEKLIPSIETPHTETDPKRPIGLLVAQRMKYKKYERGTEVIHGTIRQRFVTFLLVILAQLAKIVRWPLSDQIKYKKYDLDIVVTKGTLLRQIRDATKAFVLVLVGGMLVTTISRQLFTSWCNLHVSISVCPQVFGLALLREIFAKARRQQNQQLNVAMTCCFWGFFVLSLLISFGVGLLVFAAVNAADHGTYHLTLHGDFHQDQAAISRTVARYTTFRCALNGILLGAVKYSVPCTNDVTVIGVANGSAHIDLDVTVRDGVYGPVLVSNHSVGNVTYYLIRDAAQDSVNQVFNWFTFASLVIAVIFGTYAGPRAVYSLIILGIAIVVVIYVVAGINGVQVAVPFLCYDALHFVVPSALHIVLFAFFLESFFNQPTLSKKIEVRELIKKMTHIEPEKRISAAETCEILQNMAERNNFCQCI